MMVFTHILVGALVGALAGLRFPTLAPNLVVIGAVAGGIPDLDMAKGHRRSLHYPFLGSVVALIAIIAAVLVPTPVVVSTAVFTLAFALHSIMDVFGGGKELRPWARTDDRAVYDHVRRRWLRARRVVYDGSPGDLVICALAGIAVSLLAAPQFGVFVGVILVLATAYAVLRREITRRLPGDVDTYESWLKDVGR